VTTGRREKEKRRWTQRKVTGKRKEAVDAEKSDGKKIRRP
jgi:hypothetical protein